MVVYVRDAFPEDLAGSAFVALDPELALPFHLVRRAGAPSAAVRTVVEAAAGLDARCRRDAAAHEEPAPRATG